VTDHEREEVICGTCGRVSNTQRGELSAPLAIGRETLGSIPDPTFSGSTHGILGSLKRVGVMGLPDWSDASWEMLVRETSRRLGTPGHVAQAVSDFRARHRECFQRLRRREAVSALFYVFVKCNPRDTKSLDDICEVTGADRQRTGKYLRRFIIDNGLKTQHKQSEDYISQLASKLGASSQMIERSIELVRQYRKTSFDTITPRSLGACALYLASREGGSRCTQREVGNAFGVAEYTVRENSIKMKKVLMS